MASIKIKGLDKLEKALKENKSMDEVKKCVRFHGTQLQQKMQRNADFSQGYQTGQTKRSIMLDIVDSGFTAEAGPDANYSEDHPNTEYAEYVEYGTRFMSAQPFVKPALEAQAKEFEKDMQDLVR